MKKRDMPNGKQNRTRNGKGRESRYVNTRIRIRRWPLKLKNINMTISLIISRQQNTIRSINIVIQQTSKYRTFTTAFLEKTMTRNLRKPKDSMHLNKHHEKKQLKLQLQNMRVQLRITKWGRYFISL